MNCFIKKEIFFPFRMGVEIKFELPSAVVAILLVALAAAFSSSFGAEGAKLDDLAKVLADSQKDTNTRMEAAIELGQAKNPKYLQFLTEALKDSDKAIRWTAAEALWEMGDKAAVPALIEYLEKGEAYEWGKVVTMNALASLKDPQAVEPLIRVLESPNPFLRRSAAVALFTIGDQRAIPVLIGLLKDEQGFIQRIAQNFLVEMTKDKMTGDTPTEYDEWSKWYLANAQRLKFDGPMGAR
jgi:HEAT repeat protein